MEEHADESARIVFAVLNSIMATILFIYGSFIIFAIIQNRKSNSIWGPLWFFIPILIPTWMTAICFYIYLTPIPEKHKRKLLLLSIIQFQWIFTNTYSIFVSTYLAVSSCIYQEYDVETLSLQQKRFKKLPQNKYLVYGLFRLLQQGNNFSIWSHDEFEGLPTLHPPIKDVFVDYIHDGLYTNIGYSMSNSFRVGIQQSLRDYVAMGYTAISSVISIFIILYVSISESTTFYGFLIFLLCFDGVLFIIHLDFALRTIKVLWFHGNKLKHLDKYKISLAFSVFAMISEMIILSLFLLYGIRDDLWSINIMIMIYSFNLLGFYTTWIVEDVYWLLGKYDES